MSAVPAKDEDPLLAIYLKATMPYAHEIKSQAHFDKALANRADDLRRFKALLETDGWEIIRKDQT